jgi:hypothetical protein
MESKSKVTEWLHELCFLAMVVLVGILTFKDNLEPTKVSPSPVQIDWSQAREGTAQEFEQMHPKLKPTQQPKLYPVPNLDRLPSTEPKSTNPI